MRRLFAIIVFVLPPFRRKGDDKAFEKGGV